MRTFLVFVATLAIVKSDAGYSYNPPTNVIIGSPTAPPKTAFSQTPSISSEIPVSSQSFLPIDFLPASNVPFSNVVSLPTLQQLPHTHAPTFANVAPIVSKNLYFHLPPPDIEDEHVPILPAPKINYKIIFIKTPTSNQPSLAAQILEQQKKNEEKTIVYVLVNKPDDLSSLTNIPQKPPTKPEVYFIKYKTPTKHTETALPEFINGPSNNNHLVVSPGGGAGTFPASSFLKPSATYGPPGYVI